MKAMAQKGRPGTITPTKRAYLHTLSNFNSPAYNLWSLSLGTLKRWNCGARDALSPRAMKLTTYLKLLIFCSVCLRTKITWFDPWLSLTPQVSTRDETTDHRARGSTKQPHVKKSVRPDASMMGNSLSNRHCENAKMPGFRAPVARGLHDKLPYPRFSSVRGYELPLRD